MQLYWNTQSPEMDRVLCEIMFLTDLYENAKFELTYFLIIKFINILIFTLSF